MKNKTIVLLIILVILISVISFIKINSLKSENTAMAERIIKLTGNLRPGTSVVNEGPAKAEELMNELLKNGNADVYMTSAYFRYNKEFAPMIGYCISFKDWNGEIVCTANLTETLDRNYHDYVTKILNKEKISEKLGDLMKKKNLTEEEIVEGIKE